jgi:hypothetical protein
MNTSTLNHNARPISYGLFPVVLVAFLFFVSRMDANKGEISFVPITALVAFAFLWQIFTLCHHRKSMLAWMLALVYGCALIAFAVDMMRFPSARQLW